MQDGEGQDPQPEEVLRRSCGGPEELLGPPQAVGALVHAAPGSPRWSHIWVGCLGLWTEGPTSRCSEGASGGRKALGWLLVLEGFDLVGTG